MAEDCEADIVEEAVGYLIEHKYPDNCSSSRERQIRKKAEKFVVKDGGEIYYNQGKGQPGSLIIIHNIYYIIIIIKPSHI